MQAVSSQFDQLSKGPVRPISYGLKVSFDKAFDDDITFFTLNQSLLDSPDILAPGDDNPLQEWDKYSYRDFDDRAMSLEVSRELDFPYSVSAAVADFQLNNFDNLFTPNSGSTIAPYVLPSRPLRVLMGFNGSNLQQFVGLTENMPTIDDTDRTITFHAMDFLSKLFALKLPNILAMRDVTTDEVLNVLFQGAGLLTEQYSLPKGRNFIKFVFYKQNEKLGTIIRDLMQAELGLLWLDEAGIIQFTPRVINAGDPVYTFDDNNIIDVRTANSGGVINVVEINATIREVKENQRIFSTFDTQDRAYIVPAGGTVDVFISLIDPTITIETPISSHTNVGSYFRATKLNGKSTIGVTVSSDELFVDSYRVTFANANVYDVRIADLVLWGEPARVVDTLKYVERDEASILKHEERPITFDNDFIQSEAACESIAYTLLDSYADYAGDIEMEVKGTPALQMGDFIEITKPIYEGSYRITRIINRIIDGRFEQIIGARRFTNRSYFVLNQSLLNSTDVLAP